MQMVTIGLVVVSLLSVAAPAIAQTADPLGLISFGALLPFEGSGRLKGAMSFLEVSSPVGPNAGPEGVFDDNRPLHMFMFDSTCTRSGPSIGLSLTANDVDLIRLDTISPGLPTSGLLALASVDVTGGPNGLQPLSNPIHARVLWIDSQQDFVRVLEPIALQNAEALDSSQVWNPLRTAAAFYAALESKKSQTTLS